jgi:phosphoribosylaminoimidazole carboxylase (NCAIR synthetase)
MTKPGRKMGHISILGEDLKEIKEKIDFIKENLVVVA